MDRLIYMGKKLANEDEAAAAAAAALLIQECCLLSKLLIELKFIVMIEIYLIFYYFSLSPD